MAFADVIPGILEQTWDEIERKVALVAPHVSWVQIEFADGTLVGNTTFLDIPRFADLIRRYPHVGFEAHLMVANPEKYLKDLVDAGFRRLIAQVESNDPRGFLEQAKYEEVEVGLGLDGSTEIDQIEPFLEEVDFVLLMMVEAGFSGQPFLPEAVEKLRLIRQNLPDIAIEADGGINETTAPTVKDAGATRIVSTSFIFKDPANIAGAVETLASR